MIDKTCKICSKQFKARPHLVRIGQGLFCSRQCRGVSIKGDGNPHWKGGLLTKKCLVCQKNMKVKRVKFNTQKYCSIKCKNLDMVDLNSYRGIHNWVKRIKGTAKKCVVCASTGIKSKNYCEWANLSGKYKHDLNDFISLCTRCHSLWDHGLLPINLFEWAQRINEKGGDSAWLV